MRTAVRDVYVVDDDGCVRESLVAVLSSVGYSVKTFSTADEFLSADLGPAPYCLVVDLLLPGMTGLQLCREVRARHPSSSAFVMISADGDITSAVDAMRLGAVDFLEKPFSHQRLLESVDRAIRAVETTQESCEAKQECLSRLARLTTREREVLDAMALGLVTKEISKRLSISTRTVDVHRSRIMEKLDLESPLQLANFLAMSR
jgi:FixJ family two-component response regulator